MPFGVLSGSSREDSEIRRASRSRRVIDLQHVTPSDLAACAEALEVVAAGAASREEAADRLVQYLFDTFCTGENQEPACALVRCFQTYPLAGLPSERKQFAMRHLGPVPFRDDIRCLTLLATRGIEPQWNTVAGSAGHQAIPLPSVEVILKAPMIARLLLQMGVRYEHVVAPPEGDDFLVGESQEALKVFHVARARGSRYIPAQASFVHRYGVRSVLGLGGLSSVGELFAIVMFTRVPVSSETAAQFRGLAATVRTELLRFTPEQTFTNAR